MKEQIEWLSEVAAPSIRYRTVAELSSGATAAETQALEKTLENHSESQKWLARLSESDHIHSSKANAAENCIAKLVSLGFSANMPLFKKHLDGMFRKLYLLQRKKTDWDAGILFPFLVSAGYVGHKDVSEYAQGRLQSVADYARKQLSTKSVNDEDITDMCLSQEEKRELGVPKKWFAQYVWKPTITRVVPTCYDFYLFAFLEGHESERHSILEYVSTRRYQRFCQVRQLLGSYGWDPQKRYCWSTATMPFFQGFFGFEDPNFVPNLFILYLDLASRYPGASQIPWFQNGIGHLEQFQVAKGRYCFPASYLPEKNGGYYLYSGSMMGLGEHGRGRFEIESTFRMLSMQRNAKMRNNAI